MQDFRNLHVWEKAHQLTLSAYCATRSFPPEELFGITRQIRRGCASIPANLAEGCGRGSDAEMARFTQIAMGSASEVEYHFLLAKDLEFLDLEQHRQLHTQVTEVKRMLASLLNRLKAAG